MLSEKGARHEDREKQCPDRHREQDLVVGGFFGTALDLLHGNDLPLDVVVADSRRAILVRILEQNRSLAKPPKAKPGPIPFDWGNRTTLATKKGIPEADYGEKKAHRILNFEF